MIPSTHQLLRSARILSLTAVLGIPLGGVVATPLRLAAQLTPIRYRVTVPECIGLEKRSRSNPHPKCGDARNDIWLSWNKVPGQVLVPAGAMITRTRKAADGTLDSYQKTGELHRRTRGTPRVQARSLDSLAAARVADPFAFVVDAQIGLGPSGERAVLRTDTLHHQQTEAVHRMEHVEHPPRGVYEMIAVARIRRLSVGRYG